MKPIKGIYQDVQPINQPENTIFYSRNSIKYEKIASWLNEPGFKISTAIPFTPIGVIPLDDKAIIFSTDNTNCCIGIYDELTDIYTLVLNRSDLGFNLANRITGRAKRNFKGEIICVFTDKVTPAKYMNLSQVDNLEDFNNFLLFPLSKSPIIELAVVESGGTILSGEYYVAIQYKSANDGIITNFSEVSQPIFITKSVIADGPENYCGVEAGTITTAKITVNITNIDTSYDIMNVVLISKINGIITAKELPSINLVGIVSKTFDILGNETTTTIDISQVLVGNANYNTVGCFAQLNNILYAANLGSSDLVRFQKIANNIQINYTTKLTAPNSLVDTTGVYASHRLNSTPRGFLHGEVYAFYIALILKNGSRTSGFHIPGRDLIVGEDSLNSSSLALAQGINALKYQVEDTSIFISQDNTSFIGKGKMGYWENQGETYPNSTIDKFGDFDSTVDYQGNPLLGENLQRKNVRHHRFPTIVTCKDRHYATNSNYGINQLDILGIDVSNVIIPLDLQDKIQGYEIYYAKRNNSNSTVVGQSLLQFNTYYKDSGDPYGTHTDKMWTTGGNWRIYDNDVAANVNTRTLDLYTHYVRFYGFDLLQNKPQVNPTYISPQLKIQRTITIPEIDSDKNWMAYPIDYISTDGNTIVRSVLSDGSESIRKISDFRYVPKNSILTSNNIYNVLAEEYIHMKFDNQPAFAIDNRGGVIGNPGPVNFNNATLDVSLLTPDVGSGYDTAINSLIFEQTYLANLSVLLSNIYNSFSQQTLVSTGGIQTDIINSSLEDIYGGDTFVSVHSYLTVGPRNANDDGGGNGGQYNKFVRRFICESNTNIGLRYETTDRASFFWNKTGSSDLLQNATFDNINQWAYNKDYTSVNDLVSTSPNDIISDKTDKFPFRIIRSNVDNREQRNSVNWRTFLVNNYYESVQNKGEIINLEALNNDQLIIHHRDSLFVTRSVNKLQLDLTEVVLGSGDIFGVVPQEPIPSAFGYLGTQQQLSCLLTKHGYFSIDSLIGNVYIYNGQTIDLTEGLRIFLRDNLSILPIGIEIDNPFTGNGISVAYDEKYERIIIGIKNEDKSFTISYDIESKSWASFHDYIPDFIFNTRSKVYSFKADANGLSTLFIHNEGNKGVYYDNSIIYSSYIDIIFKAPPIKNQLGQIMDSKTISLILQSLDWITEVYSPNGIPLFNVTFDYVTIRNNYQCSGKVSLSKGLTIIGDSNNRNILGTWNFNEFRDLVKDRTLGFINNIFSGYSIITSNIDSNKAWFEKRKFDDKFFVIRLEISNLDNNTIYLHEANATAKISNR